MKKLSSLLLTIFMIVQLSCTGCSASQKSIRRLDEEGYLYYMDYTEDYYQPELLEEMMEAGIIEIGCSTFFTHNLDQEPITCRNYDYPHRLQDEERTMTGLNVILHCKPEGKYESIAVADAVWCDETNPLLVKGGPDQKDFNIDMLKIIPYECMDGINEKGLCVSILRVDIKEEDEPVTVPAGSSQLLRYLLDDCADVSEAIEEIKTSPVRPNQWQNCHFYLTDAKGNCALVESRNSEIAVIDTDVVTNFYLGFNDAEDSYYNNGNLREAAVQMTDENGEPLYNYGYGHGYHRFVSLASQLERYQDPSKEERYTIMPEWAALSALQSVAQNPYTSVSGKSMTQYSAIYNNVNKKVEVWPFQNYQKSYIFDYTGKQY